MQKVEFRPRFKFTSELKPAEISDKISVAAKRTNPFGFGFKSVHQHIVLSINPGRKHFWSPQMDINLEELEEGPTMVRCMLAPTPTVWTMFMFFYAFFGFAAVVGISLGFSQLTLSKNPWGMWIFLAGVLGIGVMYFISWEGKKLARQEMLELKQFVDNALGCDCLALAEKLK